VVSFGIDAAYTTEELLALKDMIEEQKIESIVDRIYPMDQAVEAHRRVETEQRVGAIVIAIGDRADIYPAD
jgi:NADPH:quinone reductase-like Zn-dependent oxidoreductase